MSLSEMSIINRIAEQERTIPGIIYSYPGGENPDGMPNAPAVLHISESFSCKQVAHHNKWRNSAVIKSLLLVSPRELTGSKLKYLEQVTIPFGELWRKKFQDETTLDSIFEVLPDAVKFGLSNGRYRSDIEYAGTTWLGWEFTYNIEYQEIRWATYFIDATNGDDSNNGTNFPWKTISKVNATAFDPGDHILFRRGETWTETLVISSSGVAGQPIIFGMYGSGASPILSGNAGTLTNCITASSKNYVQISDLELIESNGDGAYFENCQHLTVNGVSVKDACLGVENRAGIYFNGVSFLSERGYNSVLNCTMSNVSGDGIYFRREDNDSASGNVIGTVFGVSSDNIQLEACQNYSITLNTLTLLGTDSPKGNIIAQEGANGYIAHNSCSYGNHGVACSDPGSIVEFNYCFHHQTASWSGGLYMSDLAADDITWRYNISVEENFGIVCHGVSEKTNIRIYNNVVYLPVSRGAEISNTSGYFKNNIVRGSPVNEIFRLISIPGGGSFISDHNDFGPEKADFISWLGNPYSTLAAYVAAQNQDAHSIIADPLFISASDFHLQASSPCRNTGTDVGNTNDYDGNSVPLGAAVDIGAYEFVE